MRNNPPENFTVLILTYGRAENQVTYKTLQKQGYTGPLYFVCSDDDEQLPIYKKKYGKYVVVFNKDEIAKETDLGDNFDDRRVVIFARNAAWGIAKKLGYQYFLVLDDDYTSFDYRDLPPGRNRDGWVIKDLNKVFSIYLEYYKSIDCLTLCFSQGGDFIGGSDQKFDKQGVKLWRKAMNSFFCSTTRPFKFIGTINEDTNTYTLYGHRGKLFLTAPNVSLTQLITQTNEGGLTTIYLDKGTYYKSFYTVIFAPSCAKVSYIQDTNVRIHHRINWNRTTPKIIAEELKK